MGCTCSRRVQEDTDIPHHEDDPGESVPYARNIITPRKFKKTKRRVALLVSELPKMDHHQQQGSPILPKQMEAAACDDLGAEADASTVEEDP
ncbi:unnamed protein product, partial [Ascophyllum nodosum]